MKYYTTCEVCGRELYDTRLYHADGKIVCHKHYRQFIKHKKFLDNNPRTQKDPNEITVDGDVAYVHLYNKKCDEVAIAIIDAEDVSKVKDIKWKLTQNHYVASTAGNNGRTLFMHRFIMGLQNDDAKLVDHADHDKLNNQKYNLRVATPAQNAMNKNSKGYYQSGINKWTAQIKLNQTRLLISSFDTEEEAKYARYVLETLVFRQFQMDTREEPELDYEKKWPIELYIRSKLMLLRPDLFDKIHICTSSLKNLKYVFGDFYPISIDFDGSETNELHTVYHKLVPDEECHKIWMGRKTNPKFVERYALNTLKGLSQDQVLKDLFRLSNGRNVVLVTKHSKADSFDHRMLVSRWFEMYAIPCPEVDPKYFKH